MPQMDSGSALVLDAAIHRAVVGTSVSHGAKFHEDQACAWSFFSEQALFTF